MFPTFGFYCNMMGLLAEDVSHVVPLATLCKACAWEAATFKKVSAHFSMCACHPGAQAMLNFSVSFQFCRMTSPDPKTFPKPSTP